MNGGISGTGSGRASEFSSLSSSSQDLRTGLASRGSLWGGPAGLQTLGSQIRSSGRGWTGSAQAGLGAGLVGLLEGRGGEARLRTGSGSGCRRVLQVGVSSGKPAESPGMKPRISSGEKHLVPRGPPIPGRSGRPQKVNTPCWPGSHLGPTARPVPDPLLRPFWQVSLSPPRLPPASPLPASPQSICSSRLWCLF